MHAWNVSRLHTPCRPSRPTASFASSSPPPIAISHRPQPVDSFVAIAPLPRHPTPTNQQRSLDRFVALRKLDSAPYAASHLTTCTVHALRRVALDISMYSQLRRVDVSPVNGLYLWCVRGAVECTERWADWMGYIQIRDRTYDASPSSSHHVWIDICSHHKLHAFPHVRNPHTYPPPVRLAYRPTFHRDRATAASCKHVATRIPGRFCVRV